MTSKLFKFQTPLYDTFELEFHTSSSYESTIKDLKRGVFDSGMFLVAPNLLRFVQNAMELHDTENLSFIDSNKIITIVTKVASVSETPRLHFFHNEFVQRIQPADGSINISVIETIRISFGPNSHSHMLFIPALLNSEDKMSCLYSGNMLAHFNNSVTAAAKCGYVEWASGADPRAEGLLLLRVDEYLELHLGDVRYSVNSALNYDYDRGDNNSWQRYTSVCPVPCVLSSSFQKDCPTCEVVMRPCAPLARNTNYAVLLCNNVPTVPVGLQDSTPFAFMSLGVGDDRLFLFRTEK